MALDPFERFEIAHLSPSSCNLFVTSPASFVMQKVLKKNSSVGPAAHRGTSVETGIAHGLMDPSASLEECVSIARQQFNSLVALSPDSRVEKEKDALPDMIKLGLQELRPYGIPSSTQGHIEHAVEGLHVPLIGYYDFEFEQKGVLIDLKTTHAIPSKISVPHARQVSLYKACRGDNLSARISYVSTKRTATYELENHREHLLSLERVALTIQRFLSITDDPQELASLIVPDVDTYHFSDPVYRQQAFEIFGI